MYNPEQKLWTSLAFPVRPVTSLQNNRLVLICSIFVYISPHDDFNVMIHVSDQKLMNLNPRKAREPLLMWVDTT